ncbi:hypothetical protein V6N13_031424 [Hibiscus sabdariffa]
MDEPFVKELKAGIYSQMQLGTKAKKIIWGLTTTIYQDLELYKTRSYRLEDMVLENDIIKFISETKRLPTEDMAVKDALRNAEKDAVEIIFKLCGGRKDKIPTDLAEMMCFMTDDTFW